MLKVEEELGKTKEEILLLLRDYELEKEETDEENRKENIEDEITI